MKTLSDLLLPVLIFGLLLAAGWKRLDALEGFIRGARQGMAVSYAHLTLPTILRV